MNLISKLLILASFAFLSLPQNLVGQQKADKESKIFQNLTANELRERGSEYRKLKWHATDIKVRVGSDAPVFDVVFEHETPSIPCDISPAIPNRSLESVRQRKAKIGWVAGVQRTYQMNNQIYHTIVWYYSPPKNPLKNIWAKRKMKASGAFVSKLSSVDKLVRQFLIENRIPGAALAISRNGRMVYSRGFGYANLDNKIQIQEKDSLFRIVNLSQAITATAIVLLISKNDLKFDQPVFELLNLRPHQANLAMDERLANITVRHLLYHASGFSDSKMESQAFFTRDIGVQTNQPIPLSSVNLIRHMMSQRLEFDPGSKSEYAVMNYILLGRVIEAASGMPYEKFVQTKVLKPLGIRSMKIGRGAQELAEKREVTYYTQDGRYERSDLNPLGTVTPVAYRINLSAMDASLGWIGTARDLLKFSDSFNKPSRHKVLSKRAANAVFQYAEDLEKPDTVWHRGMGWFVQDKKPQSVSRILMNGITPGSSASSTRRSDGVNFVILFNCNRTKDGKSAMTEFTKRLNELIPSIQEWPR